MFVAPLFLALLILLFLLFIFLNNQQIVQLKLVYIFSNISSCYYVFFFFNFRHILVQLLCIFMLMTSSKQRNATMTVPSEWKFYTASLGNMHVLRFFIYCPPWRLASCLIFFFIELTVIYCHIKGWLLLLQLPPFFLKLGPF